MALPNDSITVTPGTGATVPTHLVSGKEYEVIMEADARGHIKGSKPGFLAYYTPQTNASGREVAELFNANASTLVLVRGIWIIPTASAITGEHRSRPGPLIRTIHWREALRLLLVQPAEQL
jgi:hypothetical protein